MTNHAMLTIRHEKTGEMVEGVQLDYSDGEKTIWVSYENLRDTYFHSRAGWRDITPCGASQGLVGPDEFVTTKAQARGAFLPATPKSQSGVYRVTTTHPIDEEGELVEVHCRKTGSHLQMNFFQTTNDKDWTLKPGDLIDIHF